MKVRKYPGDNTKDVIDHVKRIIRKKPDLIIVHSGFNDITAGKDTEKDTRKVIDSRLSHMIQKLRFPSVRSEKTSKGFAKKVEPQNTILQEVFRRNDVYLIGNKNIDDTCLFRKKCHLNRKGTSFLANNFKNIINDT